MDEQKMNGDILKELEEIEKIEAGRDKKWNKIRSWK